MWALTVRTACFCNGQFSRANIGRLARKHSEDDFGVTAGVWELEESVLCTLEISIEFSQDF